ncbi:MAG: ABC transporter permease [Actinobacteria bacterium]|nr:ABC transporter permease [Actinomycetota bacterium]
MHSVALLAQAGGNDLFSNFLAFTILGIVSAAIYAIAASGLVVTYTTSGIFNFAHGAIGMMGAFTYWQLAVKWKWPTLLAIAVVLLVIAPAFGWLIDRVIMRGLEGTSEVTKIVVTIGLTFGLIALAPVIWSPRENRKVQPLFAGNKFELGSVSITYHQIVIIVVALAVAVGLRLLLYKTRPGVSMRAVVDSRSLVQLNGGRPNRSSALSWALGCSLAALAGILIADRLGLEVLSLTFLVINAYAAAIVGRLVSLPLTYLGALILGLVENYAVGYLPTNPQFLTDRDIDLTTTLRIAIPVIMLFIVLLILPHAPLRAHGLQRSREGVEKPTWAWALVGFGAFIVATATVTLFLSDKNVVSWSKALVFALIMLSLVPLTGFGGQISLAQMTFAGIGAVTMAKVGGESGNLLGIVLAILIAAAVGALVALPALRLRGIYLALATLAFAFFMDKVVFSQKAVFENGSLSVGRPPFLENDRVFMVFIAVVFSVVGIVVVWLRLGPFGRRLQAMKDSPAACATLGLNLTVTKLQVFMLSAGIAGLGGAMFGMLQKTATPTNFEALSSLPILLMAVAGGVSMVSGALLGGLLYGSFPVISEAIPALSSLLLVAPGLIGISLGRNPNGAANEIGTTVRQAIDKRRGRIEHDKEPSKFRAPMEPHLEVETLGIDRGFGPEDLALIDEVVRLDEEVVASGPP